MRAGDDGSFPRPPFPPQDFYDVREMIGHGTSGEVRRAINRATGKQVAVKVSEGLTGAPRTHWCVSAVRFIVVPGIQLTQGASGSPCI